MPKLLYFFYFWFNFFKKNSDYCGDGEEDLAREARVMLPALYLHASIALTSGRVSFRSSGLRIM